jgi:predicted enzyme related to lactoylglutathione lyase
VEHLFNWIEIPVADMKRAVSFYGEILEIELHELTMGPIDYALFPSKDQHNCGALAKGDGYVPGAQGPIIYLNGGNDLQDVLDRVHDAGGQILVPKQFVTDDVGHIALIRDTEGNKIGLHSRAHRPSEGGK